MKKKSRCIITLKGLKASTVAVLNQDIIKEQEEEATGKKESKYGNKKTIVDGFTFDSGKEAGRYCQLKLMERAGIIRDLRRQVEYELNPGGTHSLKYISDFEYTISATCERVIEDVKGFRTREYLKKRRLMKKVHGIEIKEV